MSEKPPSSSQSLKYSRQRKFVWMSSKFSIHLHVPLTRHSLHARCNSSSFLGFFAWFLSSGENTGVWLAWLLGPAVLSEISPPAVVSSTCRGVLHSLGVLTASTSFGESAIRSHVSVGVRVHVIASSTSCGVSLLSGASGASVFHFVCAMGAPATSTERGLESSESRACASCSTNSLTFLEEHLSNGGLDVNLLKYFALNNAIFRLLVPDSFWLSNSNCWIQRINEWQTTTISVYTTSQISLYCTPDKLCKARISSALEGAKLKWTIILQFFSATLKFAISSNMTSKELAGIFKRWRIVWRHCFKLACMHSFG